MSPPKKRPKVIMRKKRPKTDRVVTPTGHRHNGAPKIRSFFDSSGKIPQVGVVRIVLNSGG